MQSGGWFKVQDVLEALHLLRSEINTKTLKRSLWQSEEKLVELSTCLELTCRFLAKRREDNEIFLTAQDVAAIASWLQQTVKRDNKRGKL